MITDPKFIALNREAELAKRLTCSGLSALRKATPARPGVYYEAFFGISIGLERLAKLAWLIDECITRSGAFPTDRDLRAIGHDIMALLNKATAIRSNRHFSKSALAESQSTYALPSDAITVSLIEFLSDFAKATRYFNIDLMVGGQSSHMDDPIKVWHNMIGSAVRSRLETKAKKKRLQTQAAKGAHALSPAVVFSTSADGTLLTNVSELLLSEYQAGEINKQAQSKTLGIVRFLSLLLIDLSEAAHAAGLNFIPYLREHFGFFCADDAIIRRYKTWPPRGVT